MSSGFQLAMLAPSSFAIISPATCRSLEPAGKSSAAAWHFERGLDVARAAHDARRRGCAVVRTCAR